MRHAALSVLALAAAAAGCARPGSVGPAPAPTPAAGAPGAPAPAGVRELDPAAAAELTRAFVANPVAAKAAYAGVRWRFAARVDEFLGDSDLTVVIPAPGPGELALAMRSPAEVGRVRRGETHAFEGVITDFRPDQLGGVALADCTAP